MRRAVFWTDNARNAYLDIIRYIAADSPLVAERVADRIDACAGSLVDFATGRAGRVSGTYEKAPKGLPYILAYEIVNDGSGSEYITILHLIHAARDWQAER